MQRAKFSTASPSAWAEDLAGPLFLLPPLFHYPSFFTIGLGQNFQLLAPRALTRPRQHMLVNQLAEQATIFQYIGVFWWFSYRGIFPPNFPSMG